MSNTSDEHNHSLMASVGWALNAWALTENGMGLLFYNVSGIRDMARAGAIFDSIVAFKGRIAMLDAAIMHEPLISAEEKEVWLCLSARLRKLYRRRHAIAHFSVIDFDANDGISPFFTWNKYHQKTTSNLTRDQIRQRSSQFSEACAAVGWFSVQMQQRKLQIEHDPQLYEPPPLIVRIQELLVRKKEGQPPPPQSLPA